LLSRTGSPRLKETESAPLDSHEPQTARHVVAGVRRGLRPLLLRRGALPVAGLLRAAAQRGRGELYLEVSARPAAVGPRLHGSGEALDELCSGVICVSLYWALRVAIAKAAVVMGGGVVCVN
jgi:hypothetical protein